MEIKIPPGNSIRSEVRNEYSMMPCQRKAFRQHFKAIQLWDICSKCGIIFCLCNWYQTISHKQITSDVYANSFVSPQQKHFSLLSRISFSLSASCCRFGIGFYHILTNAPFVNEILLFWMNWREIETPIYLYFIAVRFLRRNEINLRQCCLLDFLVSNLNWNLSSAFWKRHIFEVPKDCLP